MTYAGFFVHLNDIPPVLRWLQWLCPLKYTLEALSVNEVGSGLMIEDSLEGVPVNVSAALIMQTVSRKHHSIFCARGEYSCVFVLVLGSCLGLGRTIIIGMYSCYLRSLLDLGSGSSLWCG